MRACPCGQAGRNADGRSVGRFVRSRRGSLSVVPRRGMSPRRAVTMRVGLPDYATRCLGVCGIMLYDERHRRAREPPFQWSTVNPRGRISVASHPNLHGGPVSSVGVLPAPVPTAMYTGRVEFLIAHDVTSVVGFFLSACVRDLPTINKYIYLFIYCSSSACRMALLMNSPNLMP